MDPFSRVVSRSVRSGDEGDLLALTTFLRPFPGARPAPATLDGANTQNTIGLQVSPTG